MKIVETSAPTTANVRSARASADGLEQVFLAEMLKCTAAEDFNGGQFSSLLIERYAQMLAARIDLGLV
ncbi:MULTISPECIES: hypothetical protein [unclassified Paracoccus (in: a-proteobacteria)]|uniref:hypothetical protein n=1 Tax=unclassified Paracoccus (in: a-proteobacteria) TaxID=2688777 RepID=UPI0012B2DDC3|nr:MULTISPECIES: hypothetical protein [unclassified Paracoccus (in: a-proteobacteria)]UXU75358.1 hypothetical protein GB879_002330 [Paracoccus sp. SMMA_5]UXU81262.1 hypothetical protein GB880_002325 [Paracoccus sp. SMMA_5_TC]